MPPRTIVVAKVSLKMMGSRDCRGASGLWRYGSRLIGHERRSTQSVQKTKSLERGTSINDRGRKPHVYCTGIHKATKRKVALRCQCLSNLVSIGALGERSG